MAKKMSKKEKQEVKKWRRDTTRELQRHPLIRTKKRAKMVTKIIEDTIEESFEKDKLSKMSGGSRFETMRRERKKGYVK